MVVAGDDETLLMIMINDGKSEITSYICTFPLKNFTLHCTVHCWSQKKLEVGHSTVKFQEKKGE